MELDKFTVLGIDGATGQRFQKQCRAIDPDAAEKLILMENPDVLIAGVVEGHINTTDLYTYYRKNYSYSCF